MFWLFEMCIQPSVCKPQFMDRRLDPRGPGLCHQSYSRNWVIFMQGFVIFPVLLSNKILFLFRIATIFFSRRSPFGMELFPPRKMQNSGSTLRTSTVSLTRYRNFQELVQSSFSFTCDLNCLFFRSIGKQSPGQRIQLDVALARHAQDRQDVR